MSIVRYRQWPTQSEIHRLLSPLLETASAGAASVWVPAVDIREEASGFVVLADLPGVDPSSIDVQMEKGVLTISGQRTSAQLAEGERVSRNERAYGNFNRRFVLPDGADAEGIVASSHNGVLEVRVPKRSEAAPRRIQVVQGQPNA